MVYPLILIRSIDQWFCQQKSTSQQLKFIMYQLKQRRTSLKNVVLKFFFFKKRTSSTTLCLFFFTLRRSSITKSTCKWRRSKHQTGQNNLALILPQIHLVANINVTHHLSEKVGHFYKYLFINSTYEKLSAWLYRKPGNWNAYSWRFLGWIFLTYTLNR